MSAPFPLDPPAAECGPEAPTPERILKMAWGYAPELILAAALQNGLFEALEAGAQTVEQVSKKTGASARGVRAVLNALGSFGLVEKPTQTTYALAADSAAFLVKSKPGNLVEFFSMTPTAVLAWTKLPEVLRTGAPVVAINREQEGSAFFEQLVGALFPLSYPRAQALGKALGLADRQGLFSVLDLGAGSGAWGIGLAQQGPRVTVTAVDWPQVLAITEGTFERFNLTDRFTGIAGDLLEAPYGSDHQLAVLGQVLHSEGARRSRAILRRAYEALAPGGTIAIAEFLANEARTGPALPMIFAVGMLVHSTEGDVFSFEEISRWLEEAGFIGPRLLEVPLGPSPLILAEKPKAGGHLA